MKHKNMHPELRKFKEELRSLANMDETSRQQAFEKRIQELKEQGEEINIDVIDDLIKRRH